MAKNAEHTESPESPAKASSTEVQSTRPIEPRVDIFEQPEQVTLCADLPGVSRDNLNISVENDTLTIEGVITVPIEQQHSHQEITAPYYRRNFTLGKEIDSEQIQANFVDGVLTLKLPKRAESKPRRIKIS